MTWRHKTASPHHAAKPHKPAKPKKAPAAKRPKSIKPPHVKTVRKLTKREAIAQAIGRALGR